MGEPISGSSGSVPQEEPVRNLKPSGGFFSKLDRAIGSLFTLHLSEEEKRELDREIEAERIPPDFEASIGERGAEIRKKPKRTGTKAQMKKIRNAIVQADVNKLDRLLSKYPEAVNGAPNYALIPLELAASISDKNDRRDLINVVLQHKPDLSIPDRTGCTVFHRLTWGKERLDFAEMLLNYIGPDRSVLEIPDKWGGLAMEHAESYGFHDLARMLDPDYGLRGSEEGSSGALRGESERAPSYTPYEGLRPPATHSFPSMPGVSRDAPFDTTHHMYYLHSSPLPHYSPHAVAARGQIVPSSAVRDAMDALETTSFGGMGRARFDEGGRGYIQVGTEESDSSDLDVLVNIFADKESSDVRFVFVPVQLENGYTAALVCDREARNVEVFDPCGLKDPALTNWGGLLGKIARDLVEQNVSIKTCLEAKFSPLARDSAVYALLYAHHRMDHPEIKAEDLHRSLDYAAAESQINPGAEEKRMSDYRKKIFGRALTMVESLNGTANRLEAEQEIPPINKDYVDSAFRREFPYTHVNHRLQLAENGLTIYDYVNRTDTYRAVSGDPNVKERDDEGPSAYDHVSDDDRDDGAGIGRLPSDSDSEEDLFESWPGDMHDGTFPQDVAFASAESQEVGLDSRGGIETAGFIYSFENQDLLGRSPEEVLYVLKAHARERHPNVTFPIDEHGSFLNLVDDLDITSNQFDAIELMLKNYRDEALNAPRFGMVPIRFDDKTWGVIIVDAKEGTLELFGSYPRLHRNESFNVLRNAAAARTYDWKIAYTEDGVYENEQAEGNPFFALQLGLWRLGFPEKSLQELEEEFETLANDLKSPAEVELDTFGRSGLFEVLDEEQNRAYEEQEKQDALNLGVTLEAVSNAIKALFPETYARVVTFLKSLGLTRTNYLFSPAERDQYEPELREQGLLFTGPYDPESTQLLPPGKPKGKGPALD